MKKVYFLILAIVAFVAFEASAQCVKDSLEIYFEFNSAVLKKESQAEIDSFLHLTTERRILTRIEGHTCDIGTEYYNMKLSENRAKSAFKYLKGTGEPEEKTTVFSYGESRQKYDVSTREKNRRVLFISFSQGCEEEIAKIAEAEANADAVSNVLKAVSPSFNETLSQTHDTLNVLPPSGDTADIYTLVDSSVSEFKTPANVSVSSVVSPSVNIPAAQQEDLNLVLLETPSEPGCDCNFEFNSATNAELKLYRRALIARRTVETGDASCINLCILKALFAEGKLTEVERGLAQLTRHEEWRASKKKGRRTP